MALKFLGSRPFRYDLNQIPCDYTVEMRNRFKGLDLIDRVPDELWTEIRDIVQESGIKTIPMEKKCKKAKWLSGKALQIAVKRSLMVKNIKIMLRYQCMSIKVKVLKRLVMQSWQRCRTTGTLNKLRM